MSKIEFGEGFPAGLWAGMDEANLSPALAGPCVWAAVYLSLKEQPIEGVGDSKQLSKARRFELFGVIAERGAYALGWATPQDFARLGFAKAREIGVHEAMRGLSSRMNLKVPKFIGDFGLKGFVDLPVLHADQVSYLAGAASIVAKCWVDMVTAGAERQWPAYGRFLATGLRHKQALAEHGPCPYHRVRDGEVQYARRWWEQILRPRAQR